VRCPTGFLQPLGRLIAWICQIQLSRSTSTVAQLARGSLALESSRKRARKKPSG
jgi:hypothetical protein